jgi:hypothetical protein
MIVRTSCINAVYTWIGWNLFWLLKIAFNNKNMYSHRRGNHIISNLSNRLLIEALSVAPIIIPALFLFIVNNFCTVRRITPQNYLIFHCKVKKVNSFYCGAHVWAQRKLKCVLNFSGFCRIDTPVTFKDYGTKQYVKTAVLCGVSPYNVYKFIVSEECFAPWSLTWLHGVAIQKTSWCVVISVLCAQIECM